MKLRQDRYQALWQVAFGNVRTVYTNEQQMYLVEQQDITAEMEDLLDRQLVTYGEWYKSDMTGNMVFDQLRLPLRLTPEGRKLL